MKRAIVLNSNVLYASLLKSGRTRDFLLKLFLLSRTDVYAPQRLRKEISSKMGELAIRITRRTGKNIRHTIRLLRNLKAFLYSNVQFVQPSYSMSELVVDPRDADFANLAVELAERYGEVYLVTFNERDYREDILKRYNVVVLTPVKLEEKLNLDKVRVDLVLNYDTRKKMFLVGVLLAGRRD